MQEIKLEEYKRLNDGALPPEKFCTRLCNKCCGKKKNKCKCILRALCLLLPSSGSHHLNIATHPDEVEDDDDGGGTTQKKSKKKQTDDGSGNG